MSSKSVADHTSQATALLNDFFFAIALSSIMAKTIDQKTLREICNRVKSTRMHEGFDFPCEADEYDVAGEAITRIHEEVVRYLGKDYSGRQFRMGNNERRTAEIVEMVQQNAQGHVLPLILVRETAEEVVRQWRVRCGKSL